MDFSIVIRLMQDGMMRRLYLCHVCQLYLQLKNIFMIRRLMCLDMIQCDFKVFYLFHIEQQIHNE